MAHNWYPNDYIKSTYDIDFKKLYEEGYRGVIFDVDNTLVPHGAPADDRAIAFFEELNEIGIKPLFLSNNKEPRVKSFCEQVVGGQYIYRANKPAAAGYQKAMEMLGTDTSNTIFVGDQILTDIWGAKRAGIRCCMVEPVLKWKEEPQIIAKRFIEAVILLFYKGYKKKGEDIMPVPLKDEK